MKQSFWRNIFRQFRRNHLAFCSFLLVVCLVVIAVGAPWLAPQNPESYDLSQILQPPSAAHWFGTDDLGRDIFSRMIYGTRISLSVGLVAVGIYVFIGIVLGSLAGFYGGWIDLLLSRAMEVMLCFPTFFLILAVLAFVGPSIYNIMVVIGLTQWTGIARLVRGEMLRYRDMEFVRAARQSGAGDFRLIVRHLLPNAMAPVLVSASFGVASAILTESSLSFLGFGVPPYTPSWGAILSQSQPYADVAWWMMVVPGVAIFLTITAYNLVGDALRDAIDPRLKNL